MERNVTGAFGTSILNSNSDLSKPIKSPGTKLNNMEASEFAQQITLLGLDGGLGILKGSIEDTFNKELWNTAGSVASQYLQSKVDRIKDSWNTKVTITIGALMGEVTPFVKNPKEAASLLVDKIDDLVEYMVGVDGKGGNTLKSLLGDLGTDFMDYMMNDSSMQQVMSNLTIVKTFGQVLVTYNKVESMVVKILEKIEPLIPYLQIATNLASSYFSGGTSSVEAAQEMAELVSKYSQQLIALAAGALRKYVFSIKIKVPSLLVGALNSLSVREAILAGDFESDWLKAIFDEDFYEHTMYSLQWQDSINSAITTTLGSYADVAKGALTFNFVNAKGEPITRGEFMKTQFMKSLTSGFMRAAVASTRKTAYIQKLEDQDFVKANESYNTSSAEIEEGSTTTSNSSKMAEALKNHLVKMVSIKSTQDIITLSRTYCNI